MQFIVGTRINNAQMLLDATTYSINEISKIIGYDNQLYFSRLFHKLKGYSPREYRKLRNKFWNPQRGYHRIIKTMICGILFSLLQFLFYKLTPCSPYISATSYKEICFLSPAFRILFVGYYLPPLPASHTTCFPATWCHHRPQTVAYRTLHFSWLRLPFSQIGYSLGRILYPNLILHSLSPQVATSEWFLYKMLPHLPDLYHRGVLLQSLQSAWMVRRYRTPYRKISRQPSPACFLQLLLLTGMPHCHHLFGIFMVHRCIHNCCFHVLILPCVNPSHSGSRS